MQHLTLFCATATLFSVVLGEETFPDTTLISEYVTEQDRDFTAITESDLNPDPTTVRTDSDFTVSSDQFWGVEATLATDDDLVADDLFKIIMKGDEPEIETEATDFAYEGELFIQARRIDPPSHRLPRPGIKVQNKKYHIQSLNSEEDEPKTIEEVKVTNMRIIGISKDKVEEENIPSASPKPFSKPPVFEKILEYKQKPLKKVDLKYEKKKIPYSKPIKIVMVDEESSEEDFVPPPQHMNMRIIGASKDETVSEGPDLQTSETAYTKSAVPLISDGRNDETDNFSSPQTIPNITDLSVRKDEPPLVITDLRNDQVAVTTSAILDVKLKLEDVLSEDEKNAKSVFDDGIESSGDGALKESSLDASLGLPIIADGADSSLESFVTPSSTTTNTRPPLVSTRVTYPRPKFTRKPYLKLTSTTERIAEDSFSTPKKPIKRFSTSQLNFTRSSTIHRRTQILSQPSTQFNDILPLENFWDDDTIQKWKNINQLYADYGKRELKLRILKDAKRLRHSTGEILHDFANLSFPINKERICRVRKVQLLVVIFSKTENFAVRSILRKTWIKDLNVTESDEVKYIFLLPVSGLFKEEVQQEQKNYSDIIQTDAGEQDLPLSFLKWVTDHCPRAQMVLKVDDDVFVNVDNLFNSLKRITDMNGIYGVRSTHLLTERGENGLDETSWPWKTLPPYLESSVLLMGGEVVPKLLGASQTMPKLNHEGLYLTSLCAQQAGVKRFLFKRFFGEKRDFSITNCAVEYLDCFRVSNPDRFETVYENVKRVKFENQKCFGTIDCVENLFGVCVSLHEIL